MAPALPTLSAQIAFAAAGPFDVSPTWTEIAAQVEEVAGGGGKRTELEQIEAFVYKVKLQNKDRRFDPDFAGILTNLVTNPSFEVDATGWLGGGTGAPTRSTVQSKYGVASGLMSACPTNAGAYTTQFPIAGGLVYTASLWVWATVGGTYRIRTYEYDSVGAGTQNFLVNFTVAAGVWTRLYMTVTSLSNSRTMLTQVDNASGATDTFYVDGVQIEQATAASAYIDGSQDNGRWSGTAHASTSYRGGPYYGKLNQMRRLRLTATMVNLVTNPSFEVNLTGWNGTAGPTFTRDATLGKFGSASYKLTPQSSSYVDMGYPHTLTGATAGRVYTASFWVYGSGTAVGKSLDIALREAGGAQADAQTGGGATVLAGWNRYTITRTIVQNDRTSLELYMAVESGGNYNQGPFWVDGVQLELGAFATDYVDTGSYVFHDGFVEDWPQGWDGRDNTVTISVVDLFGWMAQSELTPGITIASQYTGAWLGTVLDDLLVPAARRSLDTGWSLQQAKTTGVEEKVLPALQLAGDTEGGYLWQKMTGEVAMLNRRSHQTKTSAGTFGNTGAAGELPIVGATEAGPRTRTKNDVKIDRDGEASRVEDSASRTKYMRQSFSRSSNSEDMNEPLDQANYIVSRYKDPPAMIASITVEPQMDSALWKHVFSLEIGDRIVVQIQPPGPTGSRTQDSRILARQITWVLGRFTLTWDLEPTDTANPTYWILGDATLGVLGTTSKLAF